MVGLSTASKSFFGGTDCLICVVLPLINSCSLGRPVVYVETTLVPFFVVQMSLVRYLGAMTMQPNAAVSSEFPSVIGGNALEPSPFEAAMFHLRQGLAALCDLTPGKDPQKKEAHEEVISLQKQVLQLLHVNFAPDTTEDERKFGSVLSQHREEAGLTQTQLAEFTGLSLSLIRRLEQDDIKPSRKALLALCSVPELKLVPTEVTTIPTTRPLGHRSASNWYVSPGFDAMQMMSDLAQQINGSGGSIEQTYIYLDHKSALDWFQISNTPGYVTAFRDCLPHGALATRIREVVGPVGLDVIALGPGDGKTEVKLVQRLLDKPDRANIRFYLLDASQPLLGRAFKHAVDTFDEEPGVFVCGIQGNFHHLPRYMQLQYSPAQSHRRRVYVMLGDTIGNLDNEPQFFRNAFSGAAPGDLLIFDAVSAFTDSKDPAEIERRDPVFQQPVPDAHKRWLGGPIWRYCSDVQSVSFSWRVDADRPLEGSYGIQFIAKVGLSGMKTKEFCMTSIRRYKLESLVQCMRNLGWAQVALLPFSETRPKVVFIFQKQIPKVVH